MGPDAQSCPNWDRSPGFAQIGTTRLHWPKLGLTARNCHCHRSPGHYPPTSIPISRNTHAARRLDLHELQSWDVPNWLSPLPPLASLSLALLQYLPTLWHLRAFPHAPNFRSLPPLGVGVLIPAPALLWDLQTSGGYSCFLSASSPDCMPCA